MRTPLLPLALLLAGCQLETVNLKLRVDPDGSGRLEYIGFIPDAMPSADPARAAVLQGVTIEREVGLRVAVVEGSFPALGKLPLGGITTKLEAEGEGHKLTLTIPVAPDAPWWRGLGVAKDDLTALEARRVAWNGRDRAGFGGRREPPAPPAEPLRVRIDVVMPGAVTRSEAAGPGVDSEAGPDGEPEMARLRIEIARLHEGQAEPLTWVIESGPITSRRRVEVDQVLHRRGALPAEDTACEERLLALHRAFQAWLEKGEEPPAELGPAFLQALGGETICPAVAGDKPAGYRGPKTLDFSGDAAIAADEPGFHAGGIHVLTAGGEVLWMSEGSEAYKEALERTAGP